MRSNRSGCNKKVRVQKLKRRRRIHLAARPEQNTYPAFEGTFDDALLLGQYQVGQSRTVLPLSPLLLSP